MEEWPSDLAFLQELEEPMKCPICFDLMKAPVMLPSCEHNYCSFCIRRYFCQREQCPTCGSPASSNRLRTNGILERTIQQFKKIRSPLRSLCLNKLPQAQTQMQSGCPSNKQALLEDRDTPRPKRPTRSCKSEDVGSGLGTGSTSRKRPASQSGSDSEDSDVQILSEDENCSLSGSQLSKSASRLQRSSTLSPSAFLNQTESRMMKARNVQSKLFVPGDGGKTSAKENSRGEREWTAGTASSSRGASPKVSSPLAVSHGSIRNSNSATTAGSSPTVLSPLMMSPTKGGMNRGSSSPGGVPEVVEKVPCPVCGVPVVTSSVNRHLDLCLGRQEQMTQKEKKKPLPKLVYNLLSDKDIRKRLKDLGLVSKGDRQALIKRHHEFTLFHNADCDSIGPKDMNELVKEFDEAHKVQMKLLSKSPTSSQSILSFTKDSKQDDIEKAQKEYAARHKDQFQSLMREAKKRMKSARKAQSASACSAASGPDRGTGDCLPGHMSDSRVTSDTTADKDRTTADEDRTTADEDRTIADEDRTTADEDRTTSDEDRTTADEDRTTADDDVVRNRDMVCTTEVDVLDDELVCTAEVRTISKAKKLRSCVPESDEDDDDDDVRKEETHQAEISESETNPETVLSKTRTSSAVDSSNSDALSNDVVNREVCKDSVGLPSQLKMASTKSQGETEAVTDIFWEVAGLGEENSSDAFECDLKYKTSTRGRGKRALLSAKPSWKETEATRLSVSPGSSQTSNRSQGKRHKPKQNQTFHLNSQEKTLSSDSCLSNSVDGSCQGSSHAAEEQSFSAQAESEKTVLRQKRSPTQFPRSHRKHTVTGTDRVNGSSLRESAEPSDECPANADGKGSKGAKYLESEKDTEACVTGVHGLALPCEGEEDQNSEGVISSSKEVSRLDDLHSDSRELSETEETSYSKKSDTTALPGTSGVQVLKNGTECFELNLSDYEDSELYSAENEAESTSSRSSALPQNGQVQELNSACEAVPQNISRTAHETSLSRCRRDDTENVGEANPLPIILEMDQEIESESKYFPTTKLKSLLKKKRTNEAMLKKSVRFAGLRVQLSDIQREECDRMKVNEKRERGHARQFADVPVSRDEAAFLAHLRKAGCHRKSPVGKVDSTQSEENMILEAEGEDVSLEAEGEDDPLEAEGDDVSLEAEGDDNPSKAEGEDVLLEVEGDDELLKAEGDDVSLEAEGEDGSLEADGEDDPLETEGDDEPFKAEGGDEPLKAEGDDVSLKAEGEDEPLKAEREDEPLKAEGEDEPLEAEGDHVSSEVDAVHELNDCTVPSQLTGSEKEYTKTKRAGPNQRTACEAADGPVECTQTNPSPQTCDPTISEPWEETEKRDPHSLKETTKGKKKQKKNPALPTDPVDFTCLKLPGDERNSLVRVASNVPKDLASGSAQALVTPDKESDTDCRHREGDTRQTVGEPKPNLSPDTSISAMEEPRVVEHSLLQNSRGKCAGDISEESKQRRTKSQPARRVSQLATDCRGGVEKPEDVNLPKSRHRRKRTNSSVDRCDQQAETSLEMAETAPKRRKTSQSRNKDAEPSLLTERVETCAPKRRKSSKSQSKDAEPSLLTERVETCAPKRRKSSQSQSKDAELSLLTETVETCAPKRRKSSQSRFRDVLPTIPETVTDLGQSTELKHQNHSAGILPTIPETSFDCEEPSETEHRNRKLRSSRS